MSPSIADLQARCELGQEQLMRTEYLEAEATLASAEADAWAARDFDTLSRLYMPLQEARRQRRQRCGEGKVALDFIATEEDEIGDAKAIVEYIPHGQLLVAGWGTIEPALEVRRLQRERKLYLETFLAAVYPIVGSGAVVAVVPLPDVTLPDAQPRSVNELIRRLPAHCLLLTHNDPSLKIGGGTTNTYAQVMSLWERLHAPFLAAADMQVDPVQRIEGYRKTQRVDYGCELAHQKAADVARMLARESRRRTS
jgi:hypothetical protein